MTRSKWKFNFVEPSLYYQFHKYKEMFFFDQIKNDKQEEVPSFEIWSRSSVITTDFLKGTVDIYNGAKFISVQVESALINHKFGEFAYTKKGGPTIHIFGKKKKIK